MIATRNRGTRELLFIDNCDKGAYYPAENGVENHQLSSEEVLRFHPSVVFEG